MTTRLFGTDGIRGHANRFLTPEFAISLSRSIASTLIPDGGRVIIGRDTRVSGPMLEAALSSGLVSSGVSVQLAGIIPTPAISFLIKDEHADLGVVISASHNPPEDNGIKLFDRQGMKLPEDLEDQVERALETAHSTSQTLGRLTRLQAAASRYAAFLSGTIDVDRIDLSGMTLVLDCAHGATAAIAPHVFEHLGATVYPIHSDPDGNLINVACGATHLDQLCAATQERGADLGIAFDGDGDRVLLVDAEGFVIDGDRMMAIAASYMAEQGALSPLSIVATILTNRGVELWLAERGIQVHRTDVGDRYVAHRMAVEGIQIGGEASGHIIFADHSPTGDGILTAVKLLEVAHHRGIDLPTLARRIPLFPQFSRNIPCETPQLVAMNPQSQNLLQAAETRLGTRGRVVLRPSGTQPLLRIMVESEDENRGREIADQLEADLRQMVNRSVQQL